MAEQTSIDPSEFEKKRDEILKMEKEADWKLAKRFEHTEMYRRSDSDYVYKVSCVFYKLMLLSSGIYFNSASAI